MQAWDSVKLNKAGDPNDQRAGNVTHVAGDQITVELDADATRAKEVITVNVSDLTRL